MNSLEGGYAVAINFGKRFGLGGLRLPISDPNEQRSIDYETLENMIDIFMDHGFNYFDTSYIYHGGLSEVALGIPEILFCSQQRCL